MHFLDLKHCDKNVDYHTKFGILLSCPHEPILRQSILRYDAFEPPFMPNEMPAALCHVGQPVPTVVLVQPLLSRFRLRDDNQPRVWNSLRRLPTVGSPVRAIAPEIST